MRIVVVTVATLLTGTSGWLYLQLRETWSAFNSYVVSSAQTDLSDARRLETLLEEGDVAAALDFLQSRRDIGVVSLARTRSIIDEPSWRWPTDRNVLARADKELFAEADYRGDVGEPGSRVAAQAAAALVEYRR